MFLRLFILIVLFNFNHASAVDINSDKVKLSLMGDLEGRSIILKIKDLDGNKLGVFKPTSGSTSYRGEYASFKLAQMVGLDIYSTTDITYLTPKTQKKVRKLLEAVNFADKDYGKKQKGELIRKEENRKIILEEIDKSIQTETNLYGAVKPWYKNFQFYKPLGSKTGFRHHTVYKYMKAYTPQPPHKSFMLKQCSEILEPTGCTIGYSYIDELAWDMSSIMVLDSVMGNNDRFPGGNVHFRAITDEVKIEPKKYTFKSARLFSLDNGAVLKPNIHTALDILKEFKISRFVKSHIDKLYQIKDMDKDDLKKELGLSPEEFEIFYSNLNETLNYIDSLKNKYGNKIWFK